MKALVSVKRGNTFFFFVSLFSSEAVVVFDTNYFPTEGSKGGEARIRMIVSEQNIFGTWSEIMISS
jgi:hypothetical protein